MMEATPEQAAEGLAIVRVLAAVLDRLVFANSPIARADPGQITKFHAMKIPGIAIQQYLERYVGQVKLARGNYGITRISRKSRFFRRAVSTDMRHVRTSALSLRSFTLIA